MANYLLGFKSFKSKAGNQCFVMETCKDIDLKPEFGTGYGFTPVKTEFLTEEIYKKLKPEMIMKEIDVVVQQEYGQKYPKIVDIKPV